jgi:protein phosphatase
MPRITMLRLPSPSLVVMVGPAGSGKSTFCRRNFRKSQIISTDACRAMLTGDEANQRASGAAFALAYRLADERLRRLSLTVFDATSLDARSRRPLVAMAARHRVPAVAVVLDLPVAQCLAHDRRRRRRVGRAVIGRQALRLAAGLKRLRSEGFAAVHMIRSTREAGRTRISASPSPRCDRSEDEGPFDIIGDVHGCALELVRLLHRLGYRRRSPRAPFEHPGGRRAVFVGDLVDRGPRIVQAARIAMRMVASGTAFCVPGNHEMSFLDQFKQRAPGASPGTLKTIRQIEALPGEARRRFLSEFRDFLAGLPPHLVLDGGRLAVAHAGITTEHFGRTSPEARHFAIFGQTTGDRDRFGLPVRVKWAAGYRGRALVVYGHTPVPEPEWIRNTVNIDTGCVYGGRLTALRYPEKTTVGVKALRDYYRPRRSLPAGVGVRAETRALPASLPVSVPPAVPLAAGAQAPRPAPLPRSPGGPPRWTLSPPSLRSASLTRRAGPNTE